MNENNGNNHPLGSHQEGGHQHSRHPYWRRAHQDWRVWIAVVVMITGMVIYVMSNDFAFLPHALPH
jgi:hypothetical protein